MTRHTLYTALVALFVGGSAALPLQAQTQREDAPVTQMEQAADRVAEPVTVQVTNNNWLDMRIYVVETLDPAAPLAPRQRHGADHDELRDPRPPEG